MAEVVTNSILVLILKKPLIIGWLFSYPFLSKEIQNHYKIFLFVFLKIFLDQNLLYLLTTKSKNKCDTAPATKKTVSNPTFAA